MLSSESLKTGPTKMGLRFKKSPKGGSLAKLRSLCFKQASPAYTQTSRIFNHNEFQAWELCTLAAKGLKRKFCLQRYWKDPFASCCHKFFQLTYDRHHPHANLVKPWHKNMARKYVCFIFQRPSVNRPSNGAPGSGIRTCHSSSQDLRIGVASAMRTKPQR